VDISEEGMSICTSTPLEVNASLDLALDLSDTNTSIETSGRVIWADNSGRAGIRFLGLPEPAVYQLKEWLFLNLITACLNQKTEPDLAPQNQPASAALTAAAPPPEPAPEVPEPLTAIAAKHAQPTSPRKQFEPPAPADYTSLLTALAAVKKEVEALGPNLDAALQLVAERALAFTSASGAAIALSEGAGEEEMICRASAGEAPSLGARLHVGSGFSGECIRRGILLRCDDAETDLRVDRESCRALGIRSMVAVPIGLGSRVIGLLEVFSPLANAFNGDHNLVLQHLSECILAAVNRKARAVAWPGIQSHSADRDESAGSSAPAPAGVASHRALLLAAAVTLVLAALWIAWPWAAIWLGGGTRTHSVQARSGPASSAQLAMPAASLQETRRRAELGDPTEQYALGRDYALGEGVPQDYAEAARWFFQAADQGNVPAQSTLGAYYWAGRGVPLDLSKAYFWALLAQAGGDEASKERVALLASRLARAQIVAEQQAANDWIKQHQSPGTPSSANDSSH
jgi:putative methionine-R-sulfoxide reductase with GAF domain